MQTSLTDVRPLLDQRSPLTAEDQRQEPQSDARGRSPFAALLDLTVAGASTERGSTQASEPQWALVGKAELPVLELNPARPEQRDEALRRLARIVWEAARKSVGRVELRIEPAELGELVLELRLSGDLVHLEARATDPRIARLLLQHQGELAAGLARWGLTLASFTAKAPQEAEGAAAAPQAAEEQEDQPLLTGHAPERSFIEVVI